jgi:hypothetical protein
MAAEGISALPIHLATRLVLDSISYSNPLPPWVEPLSIDYTAKEETIARMIRRYLDGERPKFPFKILVPNSAGTQKKLWIIPTVNDQIILQTAVSSLAEKVDRVIDSSRTSPRVFSYRYNTDPNRVQLTDSQVSSWGRFRNEIKLLLGRYGHILQLDLEEAYRSINQARFFTFFDDLFPKAIEVEILKRVLGSLGSPDQGLPLINDSLFFLGNAYLSTIDKVIGKHTDKFIRFVDDYKIFGESQDSLEEIYTRVNRELQQIGFRINISKLRLGSSEEYLNRVNSAKYAMTKVENGYISAVVFDDIISPELMVKLIARAIENPEKFMNEGYGRLILGAIRRMRFNDEVAQRENYPQPNSPLEEYRKLISKNAEIVTKATKLLQEYVQKKDEEWRTVWLLFVMNDIDSDQVKKIVREIQEKASAPIITRLWANKLWPHGATMNSKAEELDDMNYLDAGNALVRRKK